KCALSCLLSDENGCVVHAHVRSLPAWRTDVSRRSHPGCPGRAGWPLPTPSGHPVGHIASIDATGPYPRTQCPGGRPASTAAVLPLWATPGAKAEYLARPVAPTARADRAQRSWQGGRPAAPPESNAGQRGLCVPDSGRRSEEHTSEL